MSKKHKVDPQILAAYPNYTLERELQRTAEVLINIAETQGIYFAVAFLYDASYDEDRIKKLLPFLQKQKGAIKSVTRPN